MLWVFIRAASVNTQSDIFLWRNQENIYLDIPIIEALPGVMGIRGIMLFISRKQGTTGQKMKGKGNKGNFGEQGT